MQAGRNACLTTAVYGMPTYSTIRKAAAPITGGMIWPFTEDAVSIAPAFTPPYPALLIRGMVKIPPETTFDTEDPEIRPFSAEETTDTFAGPPRRCPSIAKDTCIM